MKYTNEELLNILVKEYRDTGKTPTYKGKRKVGNNTIARRFGCWNNALRLAGIPIYKRYHLEEKVLICKQYNKKFISKREQIFCSIECSNKSRQIHFKQRLDREEWLIKIRKESLNNLMTSDFDELGWGNKRKRVIIEQQDRCHKCGINEWLGESISLEVDHIDGNSDNNDRNNLVGLCPNCHSQTNTWRGRNVGSRNKVSDEKLLQSLYENKNIRQALLSLGLVAKGNNYKRAKSLLKEI